MFFLGIGRLILNSPLVQRLVCLFLGLVFVVDIPATSLTDNRISSFVIFLALNCKRIKSKLVTVGWARHKTSIWGLRFQVFSLLDAACEGEMSNVLCCEEDSAIGSVVKKSLQWASVVKIFYPINCIFKASPLAANLFLHQPFYPMFRQQYVQILLKYNQC